MQAALPHRLRCGASRAQQVGPADYSSILKYASVTEKGRPKKAIIP